MCETFGRGALENLDFTGAEGARVKKFTRISQAKGQSFVNSLL